MPLNGMPNLNSLSIPGLLDYALEVAKIAQIRVTRESVVDETINFALFQQLEPHHLVCEKLHLVIFGDESVVHDPVRRSV